MTYLAIPKPRPQLPPLNVGERRLGFGDRVHLMGVVNVTPDSFSDGGEFFDTHAAVEQALELHRAGANILDVGGESTRPGADPVEAADEIDRVVPVIDAISRRCDAWISVDTYKADVAKAALDAGAHLVNDISGLGFDDDMAQLVARRECGLVLMHIRNTPKTMQRDIAYDDVVDDLLRYFDERIQLATDAGVDPERIIVDPGIGFGKTVEHNYRLLRELNRFTALGRPLLVGTSRKSFIGAVIDEPPERRLWGTAATVACSIFAGADIVRVHDVRQMVDVVRVTEALCGMGSERG